jgi:hypothetical protein
VSKNEDCKKVDGRKIAEIRMLLVQYRVNPLCEDALMGLLLPNLGEILALADLGRKVRGIYPDGQWPELLQPIEQNAVCVTVKRLVGDFEKLLVGAKT